MLILALTFAGAHSAQAESTSKPSQHVQMSSVADRGSEADQAACTPDVFRLCWHAIPNESTIVACLKGQKRNLSAGCRSVIFD
jgi:hypothetical protein